MRVWRASDSVKPGKFGSRGLATHDDAGRRSRGFRIVTTAGVAATLVSLEVWPESHWPGFALRQTDVL